MYDRCTVSGGLVGECSNICMKTRFKCKLSAAVFFHFLAIWGSGFRVRVRVRDLILRIFFCSILLSLFCHSTAHDYYYSVAIAVVNLYL